MAAFGHVETAQLIATGLRQAAVREEIQVTAQLLRGEAALPDAEGAVGVVDVDERGVR